MISNITIVRNSIERSAEATLNRRITLTARADLNILDNKEELLSTTKFTTIITDYLEEFLKEIRELIK